jgi:hypothetical protein
MIRAAVEALDAEFDHRPGSPIGLCALIADPEERRRRPEAEWSDPRMILDPRGIGIIYEVENEGLKRHFPLALWLPTEFTFIGENAKGDHVRVHYFPGALAPKPDQAGSAEKE